MEAVKTDKIFIDAQAVNQLINLFKGNNQTEKAQATQDLVNNIVFIEESLNSAMAELQAVKKQLNFDIYNKADTNSAQMVNAEIAKTETLLHKLKEQLNTIKEKFIGTVHNIVDGVKDNGVLALNKTTELLSLKDNLVGLNEGIKKGISRIDKNIETVNAVTQEFNATVKHTNNIGKAIVGKERDNEMALPSETAIKPLKGIKKIMVGIEDKTTSAIESVDRLSDKATVIKEKKPSVLKQLKEEKEKQVNVNPVKPKSKEMAI